MAPKIGWMFKILVGRSKFRSDVRNLGWTFEILIERSKFLLVVRNSGRMFEVPAIRSKFQPNIRNFCWMFDMSVGRSKFQSEVRTNENQKLELGAQKRASRISGWSKTDLLNMNINIPRSKISTIKENCQKWQKRFSIFSSNIDIFSKLSIFLYCYGEVRGADSPPVISIELRTSCIAASMLILLRMCTFIWLGMWAFVWLRMWALMRLRTWALMRLRIWGPWLRMCGRFFGILASFESIFSSILYMMFR